MERAAAGAGCAVAVAGAVEILKDKVLKDNVLKDKDKVGATQTTESSSNT